MKMVKGRLLAGILTAALLVESVCPVEMVSAAETGTDMVTTMEESNVTAAEPDENGFVIEDGTLIDYKGKGGDVEIPEGVISIEANAFSMGTITGVTIPKSMRSISIWAFENCNRLEKIEVVEGNIDYTSEDGVLYNQDKSKLICYPKGKAGIVVIPDGVSSIENRAFDNCQNITSVLLSESVRSIGDYAFYQCYGLVNVTIPEGITYIGDSAFFCCRNITNITIPRSVRSIGNYAFYLCTNLKDLIIQEGVTDIGNDAFEGCDINKITLPESITNIGNSVFRLCGNLEEIDIATGNKKYASVDGILYNKDKSAVLICPEGKKGDVVVPEGVLYIVGRSFLGCAQITNLTLPKSAVSIGDDAFNSCTNLENIIIPSNIKKIGDAAFYNCKKMQSVKICHGVVSLGKNSFGYCGNLKNVIIPESVTSIENSTFLGSNKTVIMCIKGSYAEEYAKENNINYEYISGTVTKQDQIITASDVEKTLGDVAFPLNASTNGDGLLTYLSDNTAVVSVNEMGVVTVVGAGTAHITIKASETANYKAAEKTITVTVKSENSGTTTNPGDITPAVGTTVSTGTESYKITKKGTEVAFAKTTKKTASVTIPATITVNNVTYKVTSVAANAFKNNKKLTKVTIGKNITSIGNGAFQNCTALKKVSLPDKTTVIGNNAFAGCRKLTGITIGKGVTKIGKEAFKGCSKLAIVTIKTTKLKSVGKNAFKGIKTNAKIKVPAKKLSAYKKLLNGKGQGKKVKITR